MQRSNARATLVALGALALLLTPAPSHGQGYYPVIIDATTVELDGGEKCITHIHAHPPRVVIEKGLHAPWFNAVASATPPRVKWILDSGVPSGFTWKIRKKTTTASDRDFFANPGLGEKMADRDGGAISSRLNWYYDIAATYDSAMHEELCVDAGHPAAPVLDPQVVFNGGSGTSILPPDFWWKALGALAALLVIIWLVRRRRGAGAA